MKQIQTLTLERRGRRNTKIWQCIVDLSFGLPTIHISEQLRDGKYQWKLGRRILSRFTLKDNKTIESEWRGYG